MNTPFCYLTQTLSRLAQLTTSSFPRQLVLEPPLALSILTPFWLSIFLASFSKNSWNGDDLVSSIFSIDVSLGNWPSHGSSYNLQVTTAEPFLQPSFLIHILGCTALCRQTPLPDIPHKLKSVTSLSLSLSPNNPFSSYVPCNTSKLIQKPSTNLCSFLFFLCI